MAKSEAQKRIATEGEADGPRSFTGHLKNQECLSFFRQNKCNAQLPPTKMWQHLSSRSLGMTYNEAISG